MVWVIIFVIFMFSMIGFVTLIYLSETANDKGDRLFVNDTKNYRKYKDEIKLTWEQEYEIIKMNKVYKCECGITSRIYQFVGEDKNTCPHCAIKIDTNYLSMLAHITSEDEDRKFPFAPILTNTEFLRIWNRKEEEKRIKKELEILEHSDKEIEVWQHIQVKKMEEYKEKADKIQQELLKSNYEFKVEEFIN